MTADLTPATLDGLRAIAEKATAGPWHALGTGRAGGDHWYVCDDGESIASIAANDGENEDQRQPDAEFIAAFNPETALALLDAIKELTEQRDQSDRAFSALTDSHAKQDVAHVDLKSRIDKALAVPMYTDSQKTRDALIAALTTPTNPTKEQEA